MSILYDKSKTFASSVVKLYLYLQERHEFVMSKQILRSGTSIGANLAEAQYAISKADFVTKASISLKECNETLFWLELLSDNGYLPTEMFTSLSDACRELLAMLTSSVKTARSVKEAQ